MPSILRVCFSPIPTTHWLVQQWYTMHGFQKRRTGEDYKICGTCRGELLCKNKRRKLHYPAKQQKEEVVKKEDRARRRKKRRTVLPFASSSSRYPRLLSVEGREAGVRRAAGRVGPSCLLLLHFLTLVEAVKEEFIRRWYRTGVAY